MPTILSRFDMIYIVKDEHDISKDTVSNADIVCFHLATSYTILL